MLPFRRFYGFESWLDHGTGYLQQQVKSTESDGGRSTLTTASNADRKSTAACKSHREAERRRRQRINAHFSTLRTLLPNAPKSDKASLLAEVVKHVKELREQAHDVASRHHEDLSCSSGGEAGSVQYAETEPWPFPGELDEATVSYCDGDGEAKLMKSTLCCEDRPGLNRDLTQAIRSVRAKVVRAEMMTVGGRTKSVVVMQWLGGGGGDGNAREEIGALERALKAVVENRALVGSGMGRMISGRKRARDSDVEVDGGFFHAPSVS